MVLGVWAIVVAAGSGSRVGSDVPKQYRKLGSRTVLARSLDVFEKAAIPVIVVADDARLARRRAGIEGRAVACHVVQGGLKRRDSVAAGLAVVPADAEIVVVHDAARPFVTAAMLDAVVAAVLAGADGAVPAIYAGDTIKRVDSSGAVVETLDRSELVAVQTPQAFRAGILRQAHAQCELEATDDACMVETIGGHVVTVPGDSENVKLTYESDFETAEMRLGVVGEAGEAGEAGASGSAGRLGDVRTGLGIDVHRFGGDGPVRLGGVDIPYDRGALGHSDADVLAHAIADAVLGAVGLGDIGLHFPDTDPAYEGADSLELLATVVDQAAALGWLVTSIDATVMCEQPRIGPFRDEMRSRLADAVGIESAAVNVKATTTEGLGFIGRGEGIAAQAVATLVRHK